MGNQISLNQVLFNDQQLKASHFTFQSGTTYLLVGLNGAGKTTILESIAGIREIHAGAIEVNGKCLKHGSKKRTKWNRDALEAVTIQIQHIEQYWSGEDFNQELHYYQLKDKNKDSSEQFAKSFQHYSELFQVNEHMKQTELHKLSGGEQKKIALAFCFAKKTKWLLLDEPLAALDTEGKQALFRALQERKAEGLGTILSSHDTTELLQMIDEVCLVDHFQLSKHNKLIDLKSYDVEEQQFQQLLHELACSEQSSGNSNDSVQSAEILRYNRLANLFDPRSVIASLLISSIVIFYANNWYAVFLYTAIALMIGITLRDKFREWKGIILSFAIISLIFACVAGLHLNPLSFHFNEATKILLKMSQLLVIILLGLPIMQFMTPFRLQRSLEQSVKWLHEKKVPIYSYTMLISLVFRMIPLLTQKWNDTIAVARTKYKITSFRSIASITLIFIPFMRNILKLADQLATSLELRGYHAENLGKRMYYKVQWHKQDFLLLIITMSIALFVVIMSLFL